MDTNSVSVGNSDTKTDRFYIAGHRTALYNDFWNPLRRLTVPGTADSSRKLWTVLKSSLSFAYHVCPTADSTRDQP